VRQGVREDESEGERGKSFLHCEAQPIALPILRPAKKSCLEVDVSIHRSDPDAVISRHNQRNLLVKKPSCIALRSMPPPSQAQSAAECSRIAAELEALAR
jgi:hypothetical protein